MRNWIHRSVFVGSIVCAATIAAAQDDYPREWPEDVPTDTLPRYRTAAERAYELENPWIEDRGPGTTPIGPVECVAEYEPMEGLCLSWEGGGSLTAIVTEIARHITTTGNGIAYIAVDSTSVRTSATTALTNAGINMSRVQFVVRTVDSIWIRDYGPRYIYEGDCRAIADHTYNVTSRVNDNSWPIGFGTYKRHARYDLPLRHGGGNYHLDENDNGFATRLIVNENPTRTQAQIVDLWRTYQGITTNILDAFPTSVDATQHIDMWMQIVGPTTVFISDWPNNPGSVQDNICEAATTLMAARGFTVHRLPARVINFTHYTYTNMVIFNNVVIIPSYTNATIAPWNATALATIQAALPGKTIVQLNAQSIVPLAGVFHCIVMHVPVPKNGVNPSVHLRSLRGPETLTPGQNAVINWISDDDRLVSNIDILLSVDGGQTFPTTIAAATADDGTHTWLVPDVYARNARIRLVARDADGNTGSTQSVDDLFINGTRPPCVGDADGDFDVDLSDLARLLGAFGTCDGDAAYDVNVDFDVDNCVALGDLSMQLTVFGEPCP